MLKAPGIGERRRLVEVLHALSVEQIAYFHAAFHALGAVPATDRARFPAAVGAFRDGMLAMAAGGSYLEILSAMLAAEWMYATWCGRAASRPSSEPELRRWVQLHTEPTFLGQVAWLKAETDRCATTADALESERAVGCFRRTLELELAFHDAPYATEGA
jgi:thiaminase/transcriptional activator TenA